MELIEDREGPNKRSASEPSSNCSSMSSKSAERHPRQEKMALDVMTSFLLIWERKSLGFCALKLGGCNGGLEVSVIVFNVDEHGGGGEK